METEPQPLDFEEEDENLVADFATEVAQLKTEMDQQQIQ
jgi:hypothetical protein